MIYSMTGFGRANMLFEGREYTVEMRSVNSRYFEYSSRMPRNCNFLDMQLKKLLNEKINRGKLELSLTVQNVEANDTVVSVDMELAKHYKNEVDSIENQLGVPSGLTAYNLSRFPDVLVTAQAKTDEEVLEKVVKQTVEKALEKFISMRAVEGERMAADISARLQNIANSVAIIEEKTQGRVEAYTSRLYEKLKLILEDRNIDEARILTEAAIFADKTAIDEETVRIHSHIAQYNNILGLNEPIGRKLDFLTQELNREVNTIGSKCQDIEITKIVVEMKAEIEKIREQIQNIE